MWVISAWRDRNAGSLLTLERSSSIVFEDAASVGSCGPRGKELTDDAGLPDTRVPDAGVSEPLVCALSWPLTRLTALVLNRFNADGLSERRESCRVSCFLGGSVAAFDDVLRPLVGAGSSLSASEATDDAGLLDTTAEDEDASLGSDLAEPEPKRERAEGRDVPLRVDGRANIVITRMKVGTGVGGHGTRDGYATRVPSGYAIL